MCTRLRVLGPVKVNSFLCISSVVNANVSYNVNVNVNVNWISRLSVYSISSVNDNVNVNGKGRLF